MWRLISVAAFGGVFLMGCPEDLTGEPPGGEDAISVPDGGEDTLHDTDPGGPDVADAPDVAEPPDGDETPDVPETETPDVEDGVDAPDVTDVDSEDTADVVEGPLGQTCDDAIPIESLPFSFTGDTAAATDDSVAPGGCVSGGDAGADSGDLHFRFVPEESGLYRWSKSNLGGPALIYGGVGCDGAAPAGCLGHSGDVFEPGLWTLWLEAGQDYRFAVDGWFAGDEGAFEVTFERLDPTSCDVYCSVVTAACAGADAQYSSKAHCLSTCQALDLAPGEQTGGDGATLACRTHHAALALAGAEGNHCAAAGPTGGGICGTWCDNWCALGETHCAGEVAVFGDTSACADACAALPDEATPPETSGDSVQCRLYWLGIAAAGQSDACAAAAPDGGAVCTEAASASGASCDDPIAIAGAPYFYSGSTEGAGADASIAADACPGQPFARGGAGSDRVFRLEAAESGTYDVRLTADFDAALYLSEGCPDPGAGCLGAADAIGSTGGVVTLELAAGEGVFVHVDGWSNVVDLAGSFALEVERRPEPCEAYCALAAATCTGEDALYADVAACEAACAGFGGLAGPGDTVACRVAALEEGSCAEAGPDGETCAPLPPASAESCEDPEPALSLPFTWAGDTSSMSDDHGGCGGAAGPDAVVSVIAPWTGIYRAHLDGTPDRLYGVTDCAAAESTCVSLGAGVLLATGETLHVVVDGTSTEDAGAFELTVEEPDPTDCAEYCAATLAACFGPVATWSDLGACEAACATMSPGTPGDQAAPSVACRSELAGRALLGDAPALHCHAAGDLGGRMCGTWCQRYCQLAAAHCPGLYPSPTACATACAALPDTGTPGDATGDSLACRLTHLQAAAEDPAACDHAGLDGGSACVGPAPGEICAFPIVVDALPFVHTGNSAAWSDALSTGAGCPSGAGRGMGAGDVVFSFTPVTSGEYTWTKHSAGGPGLLWMATTCPASESCAGDSGDIWSGGAWTVSLDAGTTYHFVLDGWQAGDEGTYLLTLEAAP